jgi:hypothetical protein
VDIVGSGKIDIESCTFTQTVATSLATFGGAICFENSSSNTATIKDCTFIGNAADQVGGAIAIGNSLNGTATVNATISGCTISYASVWGADYSGGGVFVCSGATAVMTDNKVTGCHGGRGAGIANFGTLTIDGSKTEISSNTAYRYGGGIYNNGTLTVNAGKFSANAANSDKNPEKATEYAGANMYLSNDATIASAVSLDAGDVRVLDGVSKIVLSGVPSGTINVSISETAATYETQSRYAGYTVATGAGATDAGLAKLIYKSRDADASADNTAVGKWVFVKVPSANTIVVGQHAAVVYDPNASNFSGAAFAAGTTGLKSDGTVVKSYDIYSSTLPSVAKITDTPASYTPLCRSRRLF